MNITYRHFDSVDEYAALKPSHINRHKNYDGANSTSWYGVPNRDQAVAISKAGVWQAGVDRMMKELDGFEVKAAVGIKRKSAWADQGDSLDIHRVYNGQLDTAWRRTQRRAVRSSTNVVISFPLMISAFMDADKLFYCGAAALKLTEVLSVAGYNVTLIGTHGTTSVNGKNTGFDSLIVKHASAPLDINALAVAVTFAGFARTAGFYAIGSNEFEVSSSLGKAHYDASEPLDQLNLPKGNIIKGLFNAVSDRETARRWIEQQIDKLENTTEV